jgi:putative zinc finger protein
MNCRSAESLFSALVEDELSQKERRFLEAHLLSCRKCSVGLKEMRAAMELFRDLPMEETSPHFEEDVMVRIRSGEGLRPSMAEWLRGLLAPAWLRPVAVAGAGACAVWIAALVAYPVLHREDKPATVASGVTAGSVTTQIAAPATTESADAPVVAANTPSDKAPSRSAEATAPSVIESARPLPPATADARPSQPSGLAVAPRQAPAQGFTNGGDPSNPSAGYVDEYITDQFYLERGNGSVNPSVTPVSGRPSDDVYIIF